MSVGIAHWCSVKWAGTAVGMESESVDMFPACLPK